MTPPHAITLVILLTAASFGVAGALRRCGAAAPLTRWVASVLGGLAYLAAVLWLEVWTAVALALLALCLIAALRAWRPGALGGLRSSGGPSRAELGYPAAAAAALVIGWAIHGDRWLAFLAIALMAWGDASAGLARGVSASSPLHQAAASAAMLAVSAGAAYVFYPSAIGLAAAVAATFAEAVWPLTRVRVSDSWPVVGSVLAVAAHMGGTQ